MNRSHIIEVVRQESKNTGHIRRSLLYTFTGFELFCRRGHQRAGFTLCFWHEAVSDSSTVFEYKVEHLGLDVDPSVARIALPGLVVSPRNEWFICASLFDTLLWDLLRWTFGG